jgi:rubrerythrin
LKSKKQPTKADYYVCPVCGNTFEGSTPDNCPICGTPKEKFRKLA